MGKEQDYRSKTDRLLNERLPSQKERAKLLTLEKERRGVPQTRLVFLGIANVAESRHCAQKAFYKSRDMELNFFFPYLFDRVHYSQRLGFWSGDVLPEDDTELLSIGDQIELEHIERLLDEERKRSEQVHVSYEDCDELLNESDPIELGKIYHKTKAEQYPQIRWNFKWKDYSLIGIPDGLTAEFAYEYKSTKNTYMMECTAKPVADAQAGLYAHFHRRLKTRVQLYLKEERRTVTSEEPLDQDYVQDTLELFERTTNGEHPKSPAEPWKCRSHNCKFNDECPISHMVD